MSSTPNPYPVVYNADTNQLEYVFATEQIAVPNTGLPNQISVTQLNVLSQENPGQQIGSLADDGNSNLNVVGSNALALIAGGGNVSIVTPQGAMVLPINDTAGRDSLASPTAGMILWNNETNHLNVYDGATWQEVAFS